MKRFTVSFALVLVVALIFATTVGAITWGEPDNGEHPNVGTMIFVQNGVGYWSCTGTMIAPRVMLTAGHCVEELGNINDLTYVRFDDDALAGLGDYWVGDHYDLQAWFENDWLAVETVIPHPLYDDYAEFPATYDMGVVILQEPYYPSNGFGVIPPLGFLEGLKGAAKNDFTSVGYGQQGTLYPFYQDDWVRYQGTVRLLEVKSFLSGGGAMSAKFSNNPGIGGGTCYGDSGGPTFYKDTNVVVSVTSFGWAKNHNCVGNDFNFRTDTQTAQDFLTDVLAEYGD